MQRREDDDAIEVSLAAGESLTTNNRYLEVKAQFAEDVYAFIDNGTSGSAAGTYSMTLERYSDDIGNWMQQYSVSGVQDLYHEIPSCPDRYRLDLTNDSATAGTYRIELTSAGVES